MAVRENILILILTMLNNKRPEMNKYINSKNKEKLLNYIKEKRIFLPLRSKTIIVLRECS